MRNNIYEHAGPLPSKLYSGVPKQVDARANSYKLLDLMPTAAPHTFVFHYTFFQWTSTSLCRSSGITVPFPPSGGGGVPEHRAMEYEHNAYQAVSVRSQIDESSQVSNNDSCVTFKWVTRRVNACWASRLETCCDA